MEFTQINDEIFALNNDNEGISETQFQNKKTKIKIKKNKKTEKVVKPEKNPEKNPEKKLEKKPENNPKIKQKNKVIFTHKEFFKDIFHHLHEYNFCELKEISKHNKLKIGKNKKEMMEKINEYFNKSMPAITIQKWCRGFFVRLFLKSIGKQYSNAVVNETDFYTLEHLNEINHKELFYMKDADNFVYGFNIKSLITMYKKNGYITNPYNRKHFSLDSLQNMFCSYQLLRILFKENSLNEDISIFNLHHTKIPKRHQIYNEYIKNQMPHLNMHPQHTRQTTPTPTGDDGAGATGTGGEILQNTIYLQSQQTTPQLSLEESTPIFYTSSVQTINVIEINQPLYTVENIRQSLVKVRALPLQRRINELFMFMDQLGNYTNSSWFINLNKNGCFLLYSQLRDIWIFRSQMPISLKHNICPLGDPFYETQNIYRSRFSDITEEEMCISCLNVMENMIMSAFDIEYRKIGCLHVLTALTVVSVPARTQYEYLFDSLY
jgi:hypothetical protein